MAKDTLRVSAIKISLAIAGIIGLSLYIAYTTAASPFQWWQLFLMFMGAGGIGLALAWKDGHLDKDSH